MEENNFEDRGQFIRDILMILERGSNNDVNIRLSDGEMTANKVILMARSEYFATMISNNKFIEGETTSIDMSHCSKAVLAKIVKFFFSGGIKFSDLSLIQLLELSHMSGVMQLAQLRDEVTNYLKNVIILDSGHNTELWPELISGLKLAIQYNLSVIGGAIIGELHFAMAFGLPDNVKGSEAFKDLPFNLMKAIVLYDATYHSYPPTTKQKLEVFMLWLSKNEVTELEKNEIVECFNLEDFTVKELLTTVRDSGLYSTKKIDKRVLELFKDKDNLLMVKELEIQKLKGTTDVEDVKTYIPAKQPNRFRS